MSTFVFGKSKVAKTSQEIREHASLPNETENNVTADTQEGDTNEENPTSGKQEQTSVTQEQTPVKQEPVRTDATPTDAFVAKSKKTANGIVVNVPMEDYLQLTLMKCRTGRTLKDLALQAIHEFVERNK